MYDDGSVHRYQRHDNSWGMNSTPLIVTSVRSTPLTTIWPEELSRGLDIFESQNEYFMVAVGFKLPHNPLHVPKSYFDAYDDQQDTWKGSEDSTRTYPSDAPYVGYSEDEKPSIAGRKYSRRE